MHMNMTNINREKSNINIMKKIMTLLCMLFAMAGNMLADSVTAGPWNLRQGEQSNVTMTLAVTDTMQTAVQFSLTLPEGVSIVKNGDGRYACELEMPQGISFDPDALPTITIVQNEPNHYNFVIFSTENSRIPAGMPHNLVTTVQASETAYGAFTATIDNIILADVYGNKQELEPLTFDIIVEGDEEPLDQAYERAMEAIVDGGTYCISSEVNGIKYYLNISGYLVDNKMEAAIFTFKKMAGEEYPYGFQIDEVYFTNPELNGGEVVLNSGHILSSTHARNTWEAQVFFLNANGKYAIRATNAYGGDSSWALTAKTFWTVNEGINGPVAEYTFDQPFIWQIEETVDLRPEAIRIVSSWAYKLQERQGLVNSQWISNAKEPTGGSYEALSDGDYATFFHSMWSATGPNEDHYLQAELPNAVQKFHIYFQKRQQNNVDRVTVLNISASNDGEVFHDILTLDQGLPTEPYMVNYKNVIDLGAAYKYVRFSVADVNDYLYLDTYNGHHWFTFSEFYLLPDNKLTQEVLGYVINDFTEIDEEDMAYIYELDEKIAKLFESDSDIIEFVDAKVKEICVANWDTNGDGELSYDEAASVTDLGEVFRENEEITSFDELHYFTGLTSTSEWAFNKCSSLTSITIPESVSSIGYGTFNKCSSLTSITIPVNVTSIGDHAFDYCSGLTSITVAANNPVYDSRNGCNAIIETASNSLIAGCMSTVIPQSVTSIGEYAFLGCTGLTSITIPESITSIDEGALWACSGLTSITVATNNPVFDSRNGCNAIIETASNTLVVGCKNTEIPQSVTCIGNGAFYSNRGLTSIMIPESITTIGEFAFFYCSNLTSITIPENATSIGEAAFFGCPRLTSVTSYIKEPFAIDGGVFLDIHPSCILYVPAGTKVLYEQTEGWQGHFAEIREIGDEPIPADGLVAYYPFNGNANDMSGHGNNGTPMENVVLTTGLHGDSNGAYQFGGYDNPGHIHIPNSESLQFSNAATISAYVKVSSLSGMDGWGSKVETGSMQCIWAKSHDRNGSAMFLSIRDQGLFVNVLPNTEWETFGNEAGNHELAGDYLNKWINIVCVYGDNGRNRLYINGELIAETETTPDFTKMNGQDLYLGKYSDSWYPLNGILDEVCIYNRALSFDEIQEMAKYAEAPEVDTNIAFADANVKAICVSNWDTNGDGELSYDEAAAVTDLRTVFKANKEITSFDELQYFTGLSSIGNEAFSSCSSLSSLIIPENVTSIGVYAFSSCTNLTSITIPASVTSIGFYALFDCPNLTSIAVASNNPVYDSRNGSNALIETASNTLIIGCMNTEIPESVTSIGDGAFFYCSRLTSITIPESVTSIGVQAFSYCSGLTSIIVEANNPIYDSRNGCNAIIETASNTLIAGCMNTEIPESVASIGKGAFEGCENLTSITIPESVTSIGKGAFWLCSSLTSITIPRSVTSIGEDAFIYCSSLTSVTSYIQNPFDIGTNVFTNIDPSCILYVPAGTKALYEKAKGWHEHFAEIVEMGDSTEYVTLTLSIEGAGVVRVGGVEYDGDEQTIQVVKGSSVMMEILPESEEPKFVLGKMTVNGVPVTEQAASGFYVLQNVEENVEVSVFFVEDIDMFVVNGIKYGVTDLVNPTVKVMMYDYGRVVNVPETVQYNDQTWAVKGIGSYAFYDCWELTWLSIPASVETIERNVIKKCPRLAAITWHPAMTMPAMMVTFDRNPNRLYYVTDMQWAPYAGSDLNIVVGTENGTASRISLSDTEGNNDFFCPSSFTAERITYRHYFGQHTEHRVCRGWESLALPFDVADIRHEEKGTISPFAALDEARIDAGEKPFWLYRYSEGGIWESADKVEANVPYIISLPNEDFYEPAYRIGGNVTFEATNVEVEATTNEVLQGVQAGSLSFRPAFQKENYVSEKYLLNVSTAYNGHPEGSLFIRYFRGAHPFEAYFTATGSSAKPYFSVFDEMVDGIESLKAMENGQSTKDNAVYDLSGRRVSASSVSSASSVLPQGVYIKNGKKFVVK